MLLEVSGGPRGDGPDALGRVGRGAGSRTRWPRRPRRPAPRRTSPGGRARRPGRRGCAPRAPRPAPRAGGEGRPAGSATGAQRSRQPAGTARRDHHGVPPRLDRSPLAHRTGRDTSRAVVPAMKESVFPTMPVWQSATSHAPVRPARCSAPCGATHAPCCSPCSCSRCSPTRSSTTRRSAAAASAWSGSWCWPRRSGRYAVPRRSPGWHCSSGCRRWCSPCSRRSIPATTPIVLVSALLHAPLYLYVSYGMVRYVFGDEHVTSDEVYAVGAAFTVVAWGFAYVYSGAQVIWPGSFAGCRRARAPDLVRAALPVVHHAHQHRPVRHHPGAGERPVALDGRAGDRRLLHRVRRGADGRADRHPAAPGGVMTEDLSAAVAAVRGGSGTVSVVARVAGEASARVAVEPDARHYSASTMKLPILVAAHRRAERGELDLDRPVTVHDDVDSVVPGVRFRVDQAEDSDPETWAAVGHDVPLRELVERMVTVSGNLATEPRAGECRPGRGRRRARRGRLLGPHAGGARHRGLRRPRRRHRQPGHRRRPGPADGRARRGAARRARRRPPPANAPCSPRPSATASPPGCPPTRPSATRPAGSTG